MVMLNSMFVMLALGLGAPAAGAPEPATEKAGPAAAAGEEDAEKKGADAPEAADPRAADPASASPFEEAAAGDPTPPPAVQREAPAPAPVPAGGAPIDPDPAPVHRAPPPDAAVAPGVRRSARVYPDRPIKYRLSAFLGGGTSVYRTRAYRAFDDGRNGPNLEVGGRGEFRLGDTRGFLGFGAAYRRMTTSGDIHEELLTTSLRVNEPIFSVRGSVVLFDGLDLYLEPGGGPSWVKVRTRSQQLARQKSVAGVVNALGGVTLYLPKKWLPRKGASRISVGMDLGLGYTWRSTLRVQPKPETEEDPINTSGTDLGDLSLRGFTWRASAFVRFM